MAGYVTTRGGRTSLPRLIYGTAWKRDRTADLVYAALQAGFRAIDTAAQPRHYREDLVAEGVRRALADGVVPARSSLYIQTKFTPPAGQDLDPRLVGTAAPPYDPAAPLADQVRASVEASLRRFAVAPDPAEAPYLDCLVLHSPLDSRAATLVAWRVLAAYVPDRIRSLGLSNTDLAHLREVLDVADEVAAEVAALRPADCPLVDLRPVVVQNRFHRPRRSPDPYDVALRRFCAHPDRRIVYQSFWTLTANPDLLAADCVRAVADAAHVAPEAALYSLVAFGLGGLGESDADTDGSHRPPSCPAVVLDGTTSPAHMTADLAGMDVVAAWAAGTQGRAAWDAAVAAFRLRIHDV